MNLSDLKSVRISLCEIEFFYYYDASFITKLSDTYFICEYKNSTLFIVKEYSFICYEFLNNKLSDFYCYDKDIAHAIIKIMLSLGVVINNVEFRC